MTSPVLRYLGSTKNIVGSAAGLAGLAATLPTGLAGDLWPVVVAGLYGAGALLAPREKAKLTVGGFGAVEATRLKEELASLQTRVAAWRSRLAPDTRDRLDAVMASLTEILDRGPRERGRRGPAARAEVREGLGHRRPGHGRRDEEGLLRDHLLTRGARDEGPATGDGDGPLGRAGTGQWSMASATP